MYTIIVGSAYIVKSTPPWAFRVSFKLCPPSEGVGGHIVFGVDPVGVSVGGVAFLSAPYLLNHWMDLDQTGTETSLGQLNGVNKFW